MLSWSRSGSASSSLRRALETSLPSWGPTDAWNPETVSWPTLLVAFGLVWILARQRHRPLGLAVLGFYAAFLSASALHLYPLGMGRTDIFSFPVGICLFVMGLHGLLQGVPRPEMAKLAVGLGLAALAMTRPVAVSYWQVDDAKLVTHLEDSLRQPDGLILSPAAGYLLAHYGSLPIELRATDRLTNATEARLVRRRTLQLRRENPATYGDEVVEFVDDHRPWRIFYLAFRGGTDDVLEALVQSGYEGRVLQATSKGRLHEFRKREASGPKSSASGDPDV